MALGVLDALEAAGGRKPLVAGVNAVPEAITAINAGRMLATASFDAMTMSAIATEAALRHLRGERVPREIILPVQIVDAANCAKWDLPFAARSCPSWQDGQADARVRTLTLHGRDEPASSSPAASTPRLDNP
jgi:ribose transport system substrate-binding protein